VQFVQLGLPPLRLQTAFYHEGTKKNKEYKSNINHQERQEII